MHFVGVHACTQRSVDFLVALDWALALKSARHYGGIPVLAVTGQFDVLTGQAGGDDGLQFFRSHVYFQA